MVDEGNPDQKIVIHVIKEQELSKFASFKEFQAQEPGLNAYLKNDNIILCYQCNILYSFLAYTMDDVDCNNHPHSNSKFYLDTIWTSPAYRRNGYGTIVLNGLFLIASKEQRGIRAIVPKCQRHRWFKSRGFHRTINGKEFEIDHDEIKFDDLIIKQVISGKINSIGLPYP